MTRIVLYETERLTAAAEVSLPQAGMYLTHVRVWNTTVPGHFSWLYDGTASAVFPCPSNGTRGHQTYKVSHKVGATIPAAVFTLTGVSIVELTFADAAPAGHADISTYRGLVFRRADGGAVTGDVTVSYAVESAVPKGIVGHISASAGRASFPVIGSTRTTVEAVISDSFMQSMPAPTMPNRGSSLTLSVVTDAAATSQYVVYY